MTGEKQHDILNLWDLSSLYLCRLEEDEKINLLAVELFFKILAHPVHKM